MNSLKIAGSKIGPGEFREIDINIARLPSHTVIDTPLYIYVAEEPGPVLGLMAGMHGDEINGMEIVRRIIDADFHRVKKGAVVCMPVINVYGFLNYSREVPDGKDINRSFPGSKGGSLASRVAWHMTHDVIPVIDYGIDFHTGGAMRTNYPQVRSVLKNEINAKLAAAFAAPFTIDSGFRPNSLRQTAARKGKSIIVYEGGESVRLDQHAIEEGVEGALRVMHHLDMIDWSPKPKEKSRVIIDTEWLRSKHAGLFHCMVECGKEVKEGQVVGTVTDPFGEFKQTITSDIGGYVIGLNNNPVVNAGDALIHLGTEKGFPPKKSKKSGKG